MSVCSAVRPASDGSDVRPLQLSRRSVRSAVSPSSDSDVRLLQYPRSISCSAVNPSSDGSDVRPEQPHRLSVCSAVRPASDGSDVRPEQRGRMSVCSAASPSSAPGPPPAMWCATFLRSFQYGSSSVFSSSSG